MGLIVLALAGSALTIVYMLRFLAGGFLEGEAGRGHFEAPPPTLLLAPGLLAALTVVFGLLPSLVDVALVEPAAVAVVGARPELTLAAHLDLKLLLSLLALGLGAGAFATYRRWAGLLGTVVRPEWSLDALYAAGGAGLSRLGRMLLRLQGGALVSYVAVLLLGLLGLVTFAALSAPAVLSWPLFGGPFSPWNRGLIDWALGLLLALIAVGTILTFVVRQHLHMVLALSIVGYLIAGVFALELAPDVALVQVHVETLVTVLFVLALVLIPRGIREPLVKGSRQRLTAVHAAVAVVGGVGATWLSWLAIEHVAVDPIAPWFNEHALPLAHASDVVTAILVDFRALDTFGEITVFAIAAMGIYALIRLILREAG